MLSSAVVEDGPGDGQHLETPHALETEIISIFLHMLRHSVNPNTALLYPDLHSCAIMTLV
jgi:hypothetical protein